MSMFILAISCLTTSKLPWFMDLTFQVTYAVLLFTASDFTSITSHIHNWCCFCFDSVSSFFWSYFSTLLQYHIGHLPTWGVHLSVPYIFSFSYCSLCSQAENTEVVCHSLLQWTAFCQSCPPWPIHLGWPYTAGLSFIELDKAVVHVSRLVSFLWLWFSFCLLSDG